MQMKICNKCKLKKRIDEFRPKRNCCRECEKQYAKEYRKNNKEKTIERCHNWREKNKDKIKEYNKKTRKKYECNNYEQRKEYFKIYLKKWRFNNKEHIKEYKREDYHKNKNDELYKFKMQIRNLIYISFKKKGCKKNNKTEKILGCDYKTFIKYLLKTFKNNYGYEYDGEGIVHIDHIIPLSIAQTEEDVIKLCHYTNLQLLKAKDNLHKSNKINWRLDNVK